MRKIIFNDGGRLEAGYKGKAGDCVIRSIAIATEKPYQEVYSEIFELQKKYQSTRRKKSRGSASPREGVHKEVYHPYLLKLGFEWVSCMQIGSGCKVHLKADELPSGVIIARVSKHLTTLIDGIIHDTFDCSRGGTRCVYGYYIKK
jgi:hypothetical protein